MRLSSEHIGKTTGMAASVAVNLLNDRGIGDHFIFSFPEILTYFVVTKPHIQRVLGPVRNIYCGRSIKLTSHLYLELW